MVGSHTFLNIYSHTGVFLSGYSDLWFLIFVSTEWWSEILGDPLNPEGRDAETQDVPTSRPRFSPV